MKTVCLVGCSKQKLTRAAPARALYCSPLFKLCRAWAEANADAWGILSARYAFVHPDQVIEPYDTTIQQRRLFGARHPDPADLFARRFGGFVRSGILALGLHETIPPQGPLRTYRDPKYGTFSVRDGFVTVRWPRVIVLAGAEYARLLDPKIPREQPLAGLGVGERLKWLKRSLAGERPTLFPLET